MTVVEHAAPGSRSGSRPLVSLDRVLWQRVELDDRGPTGAEVAGIRRRRPVSVRVDATTALALAEAGVPTVTRRAGSPS